MIEIRFHGRGGQGAVTSSELVALAVIEEGKYAQSMPSFGPERRGAPVLAYLRVSDEPIRIRAEIREPDIVVVLDESLISLPEIPYGLKENGTFIANTSYEEDFIRQETAFAGRLALVDASHIAKKALGVPITNTTMIGALIKASGIVKLDSVLIQLKNRFSPTLAEKNIAALKEAYDSTKIFEKKNIKLKPKTAKGTQTKWHEILPGAIVETPGASKQYHTGDWRSEIPLFEQDKCSKCGLCYVYCPEAAVKIKSDGYIEFDYDYCKGCGICALECPKDAIKMMEENRKNKKHV